ncbi:hypothetical protein [Aliterella atlantica]|uniref:Uncharacterized protein n=1 Tax=Aliterella atlantica CENA595 TaxID=1618023 RepID=A0A0D8ZPQ2_9CYAN|nr:hypothetical protein [Aliterella atlantica]KJH70494.1 hypothetical protein UH38_17930 [Aliterella atlantica CENA595]
MQLIKITEKIKHEIQSLNQTEKTYLIKSFIFLINNIEPILGLSEPLLLIIDNQVLNDLNHINTNQFDCKNRLRYVRLISVFMLFNYLVKYAGKHIKIILTPAIFLEFNQRSIPKTSDEFNIVLNKYLSLVEKFECETLSLSINNFKDARQKLKTIQYDEQKILNIINKLKFKRMTFELFDKMDWRDENNKKVKCELFKPPFLLAYQVASKQKIRLKYFDRSVVNHVIASHLEPKVYSDSALTNLVQQKLKGFRSESISRTASVSKIVKGQLKGLADIEILQLCNIESQFKYNLDYTFFAVTFDKKLSELLHERTRLSIHSEALSIQDNRETRKAKIDVAQEKQLKALNELALFYQHLETVVC